MSDYIQLNRTFNFLSKDAQDALSVEIREELLGQETGWDELLKIKRCVLLAEAGSGKTEEFQNIVAVLTQQGKKAFFFRLEELAVGLFFPEPDGESNFNDSLASGEEVFIFLDAVDEAKLKSINAFESALKVLAARCRAAFERINIFVSSRASEWTGIKDLRFVERYLTPQVSDEGVLKPFAPKVYLLKPLTGDQMLTFAKVRGVADPEEFVEQIFKQGAQAFASRPLELDDLIFYWKREGRIGSLSEIITGSIGRKSVEWNEDRAAERSLSPDQVQSGLRDIAFALTMGKRSSIHVATEHACDTSLLAARVLKGWSPKQIRELLTLPVFSGEAYGKVRFQHRSIREYLAAEKMIGMLESSVPRRKVEGVLFGEAYGGHYAVPTLEPVLAWVALQDEHICQRVLECSPETLIAHGDAAALPLDVRIEILNSYAQSVLDEKYSKGWFYRPDVFRLATPELSETIRALYTTHHGHSEIEGLLLQLILEGKNTDCCDIGAEVALKKEERSSRKSMGLKVVALSQDNTWKQQILKAVSEDDESGLGDNELAIIINDFFPDSLSVQDLLELFQSFSPKDEFASRRTSVAMEDLISRMEDKKDRYELLIGIKKLLEKTPYVADSYCRISRQHSWLLSHALQIIVADVVHIMSENGLYQSGALDVVTLAVKVRGDGRFYDASAVRSSLDALLAHQFIRFMLFCQLVEDEVQQPDFRATYAASSGIRNAKLVSDDICMLVNMLPIAPEQEKKSVLLCTAYYLWNANEERTEDQLKNIVSAIEGDSDLEELWKDLRTPSKPSESELRWMREDAEWEKKRVKQEAEEKVKLEKYKERLLQRLDLLRVADESCFEDLINFTVELHRQGRMDSRTEADWSQLTSYFDNEITQAVQAGMMTYWRKALPLKPEEPNTVPWLNIAGLLGVGICAAGDSAWASKITEDEASKAMEYALWEINGFPDWLDDLVEAHPSVADECMKRQIRDELFYQQGNILHDILYHSELLRARYQGDILELLVADSCDPSSESLRYAHELLLSYGDVSQDAAAKLARYGLKIAGTSERWFQWLSFTFKVDAGAALKNVEGRIATLSFEATKQCIICVCNALYSRDAGRHPTRFEDYGRVEILEQLLLLMYRYVNPKDDLHHEGGFTPSARDNAEQSRGYFLSLLMGCKGKDAYNALCRLASQLVSEGVPNNFKCLSYDHARRSVEHNSWTEEDVCLFVERAEKVPATLQELYELASARIDDIKLNLESGRDSEASLVKAIHEETEMRKWFGRRLAERALGLFSKVEEEEYADATRPDIQFLNQNIGIPVPVELKIADRRHWSYQKFHERLKNQLIGQYLADEHHLFGIFLLVNQNGEYWVRAEKSRASFEEMVKELQSYADQLIKDRSEIEAIQVVGINLKFRKEQATLVVRGS
ncbi:hypothetical protein [Halodesulfovibrio aestuarii]|uniref:ATP-binding protein n=1 Tax=Halodesulfovibrio aestuarii TaxID=126333 RepID=A0ABV4JW96_9BACT